MKNVNKIKSVLWKYSSIMIERERERNWKTQRVKCEGGSEIDVRIVWESKRRKKDKKLWQIEEERIYQWLGDSCIFFSTHILCIYLATLGFSILLNIYVFLCNIGSHRIYYVVIHHVSSSFILFLKKWQIMIT